MTASETTVASVAGAEKKKTQAVSGGEGRKKGRGGGGVDESVASTAGWE